MTVTRERFLAEVRSWIGVPYAHQGRNRHGVDCVGLLIVVARSLGLSEYDAHGYGRVPDGDFMLREASRLMTPIERPRAGDVSIMRFVREPQHVLIHSGPTTVIHAWAKAGRVAEVTLPDAWRRRIVQSFAIRGVV